MTTLGSSITLLGAEASAASPPTAPMAPFSDGIGIFKFPTPTASVLAPPLSSSSSSLRSSPGRGKLNPSAPPASFRFAPALTASPPPPAPASPFFPPPFRFCRFALFLAVFASAIASLSSCLAWNACCSSSYQISSHPTESRSHRLTALPLSSISLTRSYSLLRLAL